VDTRHFRSSSQCHGYDTADKLHGSPLRGTLARLPFAGGKKLNKRSAQECVEI
jgi:hypothetical protein